MAIIDFRSGNDGTHDPQDAWFFTRVTAPFSTQSSDCAPALTSSLNVALTRLWSNARSFGVGSKPAPMYLAWNWSHVRSENSLWPSSYVFELFEFTCWTTLSLARNADRACFDASSVAYILPNCFWNMAKRASTPSAGESRSGSGAALSMAERAEPGRSPTTTRSRRWRKRGWTWMQTMRRQWVPAKGRRQELGQPC